MENEKKNVDEIKIINAKNMGAKTLLQNLVVCVLERRATNFEHACFIVVNSCS